MKSKRQFAILSAETALKYDNLTTRLKAEPFPVPKCCPAVNNKS